MKLLECYAGVVVGATEYPRSTLGVPSGQPRDNLGTTSGQPRDNPDYIWLKTLVLKQFLQLRSTT